VWIEPVRFYVQSQVKNSFCVDFFLTE